MFLLGHALTQTPHPRHISSFILTFLGLLFISSSFEAHSIAEMGHALTHFPHPVHLSLPFTIFGMKEVV